MEKERNKQRRYLISAYRLLSKRPRTVKEVIDKLQKWEASEEIQKEVVLQLKKEKLLNDYEYACAFIRTRNLIKPRSIRVLKMELSKKGVSEENIKNALENVEVDEGTIAKNLIDKSEWKWKKYEPQRRKQKQIEFLIRRGFDYELVKKILR